VPGLVLASPGVGISFTGAIKELTWATHARLPRHSKDNMHTVAASG